MPTILVYSARFSALCVHNKYTVILPEQIEFNLGPHEVLDIFCYNYDSDGVVAVSVAADCKNVVDSVK